MSQNISLWGANYSAVPSVNLPKQGGGTATFTDVTDTTATAADVATGTYFYTAAGVKTEGTNSGGGGGHLTQDQDGFLVIPPTGGGGGGGGDFSTAELTIYNSNWLEVPLYGAFQDQGSSTFGRTDVWTDNESYTVIMYNGEASVFFDDSEGVVQSYSISGDISGSDGEFVITGDCTITLY